MFCYLPTDLPTIVSGNKIAYLEPHEEIWKGESGRCYALSDCVHKTDTLSPFEGLCGFSTDVIPYNATLFRFPLRNVKKQNRVQGFIQRGGVPWDIPPQGPVFPPPKNFISQCHNESN